MKAASQHDWEHLSCALDREGWAVLEGLLTPSACRNIAALYDENGFRSKVAMAHHGFGRGE